MKPKKLVLANGMEFHGVGIGNEKVAEIVFNTEMIGYQSILGDPSYAGQIVCMSYPLIGNYGASDDEFGSFDLHVEGFIVKENSFVSSNFRYIDSLLELLEANDIPLLCDIDTRELVRVLRDNGTMLGIITDSDTKTSEALKKINKYKPVTNQVSLVTSKRATAVKANKPKYEVVCIDLGIKKNVVSNLVDRGCNVTLLPYDSSIEKILSYNPDGIFITGGPGVPFENEVVINNIKELKNKLPIAGVGLGYLLMAIASGANVEKMKFGHRGCNQPVKNLETNKIDITSQNHQYVVIEESLKNTDLVVTHKNLADNSVEGCKTLNGLFQGIQYHPENVSGPKENIKLYDTFINMIKNFKEMKNNA